MTEPPDEKRAPEQPEAAEGPRIGVDEWVARADERTGARTGLFAPLLNAFERIPPWGVLVLAVGAAALAPVRLRLGLRHPGRRQHGAVRAARARAERRRGLGGPARSRLHRVLRLRRLSLRDALLRSVRPALPGAALGRGRHRLVGAARPLARPAVASAARRLPRDRDALLGADLSSCWRPMPTGSRCRGTTGRPTSAAARTGSPTSIRSASSATNSARSAATSGSRSASSRSWSSP